MAPPAWFYSTIAQAAAAIIGFAIAFTIATYVSQRERMNRQTDEFRKNGREVRERYYYTFERMADTLFDEGDFTHPSESIDLAAEDGVEQLEEWAAEQSKTPQVARAWGYLKGVLNALDDLVTPVDGATGDQFGGLNVAAYFLHFELFNRSQYDTDKDLYREVKGLPEDADISGYFTEDIFEDHGQVETWLHQNLTQRAMSAPAVGGAQMFSGQDLSSWQMVFENFRTDMGRLTDISVGTAASEDIVSPDFIDSVLSACLGLGIFGIALPLTVLIFPDGPLLPANLIPVFTAPGWTVNLGTFLLQLLILIPSLFFTTILFSIMDNDARKVIPSSMTELLSRGEYRGSNGNASSDSDANNEDSDNDIPDNGAGESDYVHPLDSARPEIREAMERIEQDDPEVAKRMRANAEIQEQFDWAREQIRSDIDTEEGAETFKREVEKEKENE